MKHRIGTKALSVLLALIMVLGMFPATAMSAFAAGVPETLVTSLTELYDGDEARAREELEALYDAGLIDADGNMVALDIREDGESVELNEVAQRIADGEAVGALTVNGNAVTPEKIMQISQVDAMLEVLRLIDEDVEITDAHVQNLQALLEGIADGSIDLSDVISSGELMSADRGALLMGDDPAALPENTGNGEVDATEGRYTAPYISDSSYEASHSFALDDPENKTWYTTSSSAASDVVVTISIDKQEAGMLRLMAVLNKTPSVPVSIHWSATSGAVDFTGYTSDTTTWDADTPWLDRYIQVKFEKKGNWVGSQSIVINADNITNATFEEGKTTWSKTVQITAEDLAAVSAEYPATVTEHTQFPSIGEKTFTPPGGEWSRYRIYSFKTTNLFPSSGRFKATVDQSPWEVYLASSSDKIDNLDGFNLNQCVRMTLHENSIDETSSFDETSFSDSNLQESTIVNGEVWVVLLYSTGTKNNPSKLTVSIPEIITHDEVMSVSAPAGTYYSGQVVPVTVTLKEHAVAPEGTTLTVNGVQCPMLNNAGTEAKTFTFGYTVKGADGVELKVTALSDTFINAYGNKVSFDNDFPTANIGTADGVILSSEIKGGSLDWENVKFGIDDAGAGDQTVTVVIPFQSGVDKAWIANETVEINPAISMPVPGYEDGAAGAYLTSAYFSADGGATRYPVYVLGDNADALAVRFAPAGNSTSFLRQDTLSLYLDTEVGTTANYLGAWTNKKVDAKGFAYFTATGSEAPMAIGKSVSYFVKGGIAFDAAQTIDRPNYAEANIMKNSEEAPNGFYKEGALYVAVQGEDASKQHDVELVANEALYNGAQKGLRVEDPNTLVLNYRISDRDSFSFTDPKYFTWTSSDETIVKIVKDETSGAGQLSLTGKGGTVTVTLTVGNGSAGNAYDLSFTFTVLEGKTPFLSIPEFSKERVTLTETDTDVLFSSNLTARNAAAGNETTAFTAKLYKVDAVNDIPSDTAEPVWTGSFASTVEDTLTHLTVPGEQIVDPGTYAVVVTASYMGGSDGGFVIEAQDFSATAYLTVKQAPLKVRLNTLESYSADYNAIPAIRYTVTPSNVSADVEYTIQKSGEAVGERKTASGGTIPFTVGKPEGLKEAYTITVYARAKDAEADEAWSVDSMVLRVYNTDMLELIVKDVVRGEIGGTTGGTGDSMNGQTVAMDNHGKLADYGITGENYQLTVDDLNALRTDMSLQKIISANYGSGVWGLLTDKMQWSSSNSDLVSINYEQGGIYSDINNYSYVSYGPATDFLLVGKDKTDGVTVTATHAGTGKTASVTVAAETLKDQLYVFQFNPKVETDVVYTNGAGEQRTLKSDENGVLAVYEPQGIASAVMVMSKKDDQTYVGTIFNSELESGERDIASLRLYPCNNLRLRSISNLTLSFRNPDGSAYNGSVTLRAGVYKNGIYCPEAKSFLPASPENKFDALQDITATVTDGKLTLGFNPTEFKNDPENALETGAYPADKVTYAVEYRVEGYQTSYALVSVNTDVEGEQKPTDSVIQLRAVRGGANVLQIIRQTIRQYSDDKPVPYTRDVTDFSENIGISKKFDKVVLTTNFVLPDGLVTQDAEGHRTLTGEFALYTVDGQKLTDQTEYGSTALDTITDLDDLDDSNLFVFPFSSSPIGRHEYTMTDENMAKDGISDVAANAVVSSRVKATFVRDGMTLTSVNLPFRISNLSHQQDLMDPNSGAEKTAADIKDKLKDTMSIGEIFKSINVNDMLKKGFAFLSGLQAGGGDTPFSLIILPTEDPGIFRIVAFVGKILDKDKEKNGISIDYDTEKMYEDFNELMENDDDDDDDDDYSGEGSYDVDFSGTLVLEAGYDFNAKKWKIDFRGGKVGVGFKAKYEWSQNFMCGPVPANISFEVGANAVLEVSFASKSSVKLMLVDATVGVYIEAFAGLGFDVTIAKLKLGIYGKIGADVNFLLLSDFKNNPTTGTKLDINGEIGIRLEVKVLFVKYKKTFASTGFNWSKKWGKYDSIQEQWNSTGFAELMGVTDSGRAYSMRLLPNGTALVVIDGGGEIENRDYLELADRAWTGGAPAPQGMLMAAGPMTNALTNVQTNAYPYANPVLTDDGSVFLYISDNDNADELQSVVSYAVKNGSGYENMGALYDTAEPAILADSDVVASGMGSNIFAAWVKQNESPDKEMKDETTNDDLGMMMNATEIFVGTYNGSDWTVERLTENNVADMSPTVASNADGKAIVAWRSLSATSMPEEGGEQDISAVFDAENNINYRFYNGTAWTDAQVAYNGATGTVTAIDSAMLSDSTSILVYTVRAGEDVTDTETFYTLIDTDGNVITTGRLTNDSYADTNAQAAAVGSQFVLGWYSEHDTGEKTVDPETGAEEDVVAHDIRLARINADGSVDASFPESIGGDAASSVTSDFRFSAPANNNDLSNLSIVWSQTKDSESAEDAGKYELNAMRFYESGDTVGMTNRMNIAETGYQFTVDHFDTYTDESGKVYALVLGSDYSSLNGIEAFDRIDLTNLPLVVDDGGEEPSSNTLTILEQNPIAAMKLGSGSFPETAIEVTANTNLRELVPGLDLPVQFTVKNTGASTVDKVTVQLGTVSKPVEGLSLLPNQSTIITVVYPVPEDKVEDVSYTVTADEAASERGTLVLNRPDVGISGMKLLSEENGERIVQVTLNNASGIPLAGSGKTVKLGLYTTADHEEENLVGEIITIADANALADIDEGIYGAVQTLKVADLIDGADEIPDAGIQLYAYAWVEDADELYPRNNDGSLAFKGLLTKNNGETVTVDTSIEAKTENETTVYTVHADIRNNSLQEQALGIPLIVLQDSEGKALAQKPMLTEPLALGTEGRRSNLSVTFTADVLNNKAPAMALMGYSYKVSFDVNGGTGSFDDLYSDFDGHITLPTTEPTPPEAEPQLFFAGWFTAAEGGEKITEDYTFTEDTTVHAHYVTHWHNWVGFAVDPEDAASIVAACDNALGHEGEQSAKVTITAPTLTVYGGTGSAEATVTNGIEDLDTPTVVYKKGETVLDAAPTDAGTYTANITLENVDIGSGQTGSVTASVTYTIDTVEIKGILVKLDDYKYGTETAPVPELLSDGEAGGNFALVQSDTTKNVAYYYQATAFLRSQTENISALDTAEGVYKTITPTTFGVGRYYVLAVVAGDNYTNSPYTTQSVFEVGQNTNTVRTAPTAPTVDGATVTVAEADRSKALEYSLDGETWKPVTLDENGRFTAAWPNPVESAALLLRETADENYALPSASAQGSQTITTTTFTVTYDANGGTSAPDAATVTKDQTVTVSGQSSMTRKGYGFNGWNTAADGSGTAYAAGSTVNVGLTLYAQWQANTYTVSFYSNGGTGTMETQSFTYDEAQTLTESAFTRVDYIFLGWSKSSSGGVLYQDQQTGKNLTDDGTVALYAVWAKDLYNVNGAVKSAETGKIDIELVQGSNSFGSTEVTYDTADAEVPFTLNGVPAGTYNLIVRQGGKTMTVAVIITDDHAALETIIMPEGDTSSVLEVSGIETPAVVVSGLDQLAQDEEIDERSITITMTVELETASEAAEAAEEIQKIADSESIIEYLNIEITKTIYNEGTLENTEAITETGNVIELVIPYDFTEKDTVKVYRYHDGAAEALTEADTGLDGTYRLDRENGRIYVYASKFSVYAIGYTLPIYFDDDGVGGGGTKNYTPSTANTEHGAVSVEPKSAASGTKVTVTVKPDEGYEIDTIKAVDANGKEITLTKNPDGTYTYTQPDSEVIITAAFKAIEKPAQPFFVDVPEDSFYYDAVKWAVENGITLGTSDTTFSPNASCTRAQMVTFLWRAAGKPEPTIAATAFTDIDESAYYYKAVLWAYENGITLGTSDTTFSPNDTVTRAQSVTFLFRALSGAAGTENPFQDVKDSAYYAAAVSWAAENGITLGTSATTFSPDNDCLRAQIVTFLYRAYNKA